MSDRRAVGRGFSPRWSGRRKKMEEKKNSGFGGGCRGGDDIGRRGYIKKVGDDEFPQGES